MSLRRYYDALLELVVVVGIDTVLINIIKTTKIYSNINKDAKNKQNRTHLFGHRWRLVLVVIAARQRRARGARRVCRQGPRPQPVDFLLGSTYGYAIRIVTNNDARCSDRPASSLAAFASTPPQFNHPSFNQRSLSSRRHRFRRRESVSGVVDGVSAAGVEFNRGVIGEVATAAADGGAVVVVRGGDVVLR